jgi:hypothetical protein
MEEPVIPLIWTDHKRRILVLGAVGVMDNGTNRQRPS